MLFHRPSRTAVLPGLALALLLGSAPGPGNTGQAAAAFEVRATLVEGSSATGVVCKNNAVADALVCMQQSIVAGQAGNSEPVVLLYGKGLPDEDNRMWGAVAASRLVHWGGRDYVEMTLTW